MSRRVAVFASAGMAAAMLAAVAVAWAQAPAPLRVGLVGSFSGRFASLGTTGRDGALLAVDEINAAGGLLGRRIELVVMDDRGDGRACSEAFAALAAAGCHVAIGPFATGPATAALPTIDRFGILAIAPTVAGDNLAGRDDWLLRLYPSTREMGRTLAAMAASDGVRLLAVAGDEANGPFLATTIDGLGDVAGGPALLQLPFDSRVATDLRAIAMRAAACDGVLLVASSLDAAALAQRVREAAPQARLYCASWAVSKELIANGGAAVDGMRTVLPVALGGGDDGGLADRYRQRFGEAVTHVALLHHEAVQLLAAAIRAAGSADPLTLRRLLTSGIAIPGAPPAAVLDGNGDPRRPLMPHRIVSGEMHVEAPR